MNPTENRKRRREEGSNTSSEREEGGPGMSTEGRSLGLEQEFPSDLVDEVLCWSCEGRPSRALQLALVCRLWFDRFKAADRLWPLVVRRLQPKLMIAVRTATYSRVLESISAAKKLFPLQPPSLHPIEDCTLEFACPMYAEALRVVGPGVSYCSVCKENVYTVRTQAEMDDATRRGRCVQFSSRDLTPCVEDNTVVHVAVILTSEESAMDTARIIAANPVFNRRSPSIFPVLEVASKFVRRLKITFFSSPDNAAAFPSEAPTFSLIAADADVELEGLQLPNPFLVALQSKIFVRGTAPRELATYLAKHLKEKFAALSPIMGRLRITS